jgi:hypothetical protein
MALHTEAMPPSARSARYASLRAARAPLAIEAQGDAKDENAAITSCDGDGLGSARGFCGPEETRLTAMPAASTSPLTTAASRSPDKVWEKYGADTGEAGTGGTVMISFDLLIAFS